MTHQARPATANGSATLRRPRARVLVVEDHDETRDVVAMLLRTEGYEVVLAPDGDAAVAAAHASRPQIAIVDIFLPRKDGVAVIEELVRDLPSLAIIAVSADTREDRLGALMTTTAPGRSLSCAGRMDAVQSSARGVTSPGNHVTSRVMLSRC